MGQIRWHVYTLVAIFSIGLVQAAEIEKVEKRTFEMQPGGYITVIDDDGLISVEAWNRGDVELTITKRAWDKSRRRAEMLLRDVRIDIKSRPDRLIIRYIGETEKNVVHFFDIFDPDTWRGRCGVEVDFQLKVPRRVDLRLENDEGDIEVSGVRGDFEIEADEGGVFIQNVVFENADVIVDEGNFELLEFDGEHGQLMVDADEGDVSLEQGALKQLEVDLDEGDIVIEKVGIDKAEVSTDEGDVEVDLNLSDDGDYYFDTDEGDIRLWLDRTPDVELELQTQEGSIRSDFRLSVEKDEDEGAHVSQVLGRGRARLQATTDEGDIILDKR